MSDDFAFFATTARNLEPYLARELRDLGARAVDERPGGAGFEGTLELAYRVCLWSRLANRVLLPLREFSAAGEGELYGGVRSIEWRDHLDAHRTLAVDFTSVDSALAHTQFGALRTKDAIVDQLRERTGARPSVARERPDVRVHVHVQDDRATVAIDLAGESLHRRGYRPKGGGGGVAPLKENLAAGLLAIAGWPDLARAGVPFLDPMCGSGTLLVEAALTAADAAPGLRRDYFGFLGWRGHDGVAWSRLLAEARERERAGVERVRLRAHGSPGSGGPIAGQDVDEEAVRVARANAARAGVAELVRVEVRALDAAAPADVVGPVVPVGGEPPAGLPRGLLVTNPPYGERIGVERELIALYRRLGDLLRRRFLGWRAFVLTGNPALAKQVGLRPARRHILYNGAIECRLLELPISNEPVTSPAPPTRRRRRVAPTPEVEAFANRVRKNLRRLRPWAEREGIHCFRAYDADLPEFALAVDLYSGPSSGRSVHVQEYAPPSTVDAARAEERLAGALAVLPELLGVPEEELFAKVRRRQRPEAQYGRLGERGAVREVQEGGFRFLANLSDYLDTGLFLDHRRLRGMIGELARGRRFLNLFAYTGTATVYAARGGARATTSVDLSNTYLDWARENLALNGVTGRGHELVHADCLAWLATARRASYGLVFLAPPTFSNSKRMRETLDVRRDQGELLRAAASLLEPGGVLLFSTHARGFALADEALAGLRTEEITRQTVPHDFARTPRVHRAWRITATRP